MVIDRLFRRLRKLLQTESTLAEVADRAGVDEKTARKYRDSDALPSQRRVPHTWRTREDPFQDVWPELVERLRLNPGLQAKTLFLDNENGDVEQSHHRFKQAVDQALMLRGSRDFASRGDY